MKTMILAAGAGLAALTMATPAMSQYYSRDGSYANRDGSYYNRDGSYYNRDGSYVSRDGSYRTRNGVVCDRYGRCSRTYYQNDRYDRDDRYDRYDRDDRRYLFRMGQRVPRDYYSYYTTYGGIPQAYRYRIPREYRNGYRYIYRDNSIYVVDPTTQLVRSIIDLLAR
jgi:hypothetical protein